MNHIWSIARKELRSYFRSEVALSFLAVFLGVVAFTFFWVEKFFTRNIADVRPLFEWLPLLLIFLVAALSMRLWSEERKAGTVEVLLTLPVPYWKLVVGKFVAGMVLIALALALTIGLPITVSLMGDLDWGPVAGGYLAALLLASAYLSIGLCVSAATTEQLVSLIVTAALCALLYLPGADVVVQFFGGDLGEFLRRISTRGRFESIARGVLDLRDLAYYGSVIAVALGINIFLLRARGWSSGSRTRSQRRNQVLGIALVAANAVALNVWLAPVNQARVDLTENNEYSLSPVTEKLLHSIDQPLLIRGYFSEKTHPLLAPTIPQVRDMLAEYKVMGGSNVKVEIVDPATSEEVEKEAQEKYGIKSFPFRFADRRENSVVNAYFHILVQYGDQFEILSFDDIIEVRQIDLTQLEVKLRNFEYDLTRTIKKVVYGFQSLEVLFASLADKAQLTAYITPGSLPENLKQVPDMVAKVAKEIEEESGGQFAYEMVEPDSAATRQALGKQFGFKPFQTSLMSNQGFYLHFVLRVGKREEPLLPPVELTEASLKQAFIDGLKRSAPGFTKTVGLVVPPQRLAQGDGSNPNAKPHLPQGFRALAEKLRSTYEVARPDLTKGHVDDGVDVLLLAGPYKLKDKERRAVDQFLMRGGALVVLDGHHRLDLSTNSLKVESIDSGIEDLLTKWGVTVKDKMVMDTRNDSFPIPVDRDLGGMVVRDIQQLPYPFFLRVPNDALGDGIITGSLASTVFHFATPLEIAKQDPKSETPRKVEILASSSEEAWLAIDTNVQPDFRLYPKGGFGRPATVSKDEAGPHVLAVAVTGTFDSAIADEEKAQEGADGAADDSDDAEANERLVRRSQPGTRLVVIGSSSFVSDELLQISSQAGSDYALNNVELVQNIVDWAVADTDLLTIRSRGSHARALTVEPESRGKWEWGNYGLMVIGLLGVVGFTFIRARNQAPLELSPRNANVTESTESTESKASTESKEDAQ